MSVRYSRFGRYRRSGPLVGRKAKRYPRIPIRRAEREQWRRAKWPSG